MNHVGFCHWLRGALAILPKEDAVGPEQTAIIRDVLAEVLGRSKPEVHEISFPTVPPFPGHSSGSGSGTLYRC